jgi:hypothetical protein
MKHTSPAWICLKQQQLLQYLGNIMVPIKPVVTLKIMANMMMAGIDANAHLTINTTMEKNGICKSTTITFLASSSLIIFTPQFV